MIEQTLADLAQAIRNLTGQLETLTTARPAPRPETEFPETRAIQPPVPETKAEQAQETPAPAAKRGPGRPPKAKPAPEPEPEETQEREAEEQARAEQAFDPDPKPVGIANVQAALARLQAPDAKRLISGYGCKRLSEIPEEHFPELIAAAERLVKAATKAAGRAPAKGAA